MITYVHQSIWSLGMLCYLPKPAPDPRDHCFKNIIAKDKETPASLFLSKMGHLRVYHERKEVPDGFEMSSH